MTKVLVATEKPFAKEAVEGIKKIIEDAGYKFALLEKYTDKAELLDAVKDATALIIRSDKVTAEVVNAAPKLKIVVRAGAGFDNVDLETTKQKGIVVMNTPGQNANAVAELVLGMMVFCARNQFNGTSGSELKGKRLGIQAYGNVGKNVARVAMGFGMEVYAFDPFVPAEAIEADGVKVVTKVEDLYKNCEYVSLHIPALPATIKSINSSLLTLMPKGATLVNTARKEVINEEDLAEMLRNRPDFSYIADVAPDNAEALNKEFAGRVFFTPKKMGAQTGEANVNAGLAAAKQIIGYIKDGNETFRVNK